MENKQPSFVSYLALGAVTIGASLTIIYILFVSGIFKVTFNNDAALVLVGTIYGISLFSIITLVYKWKEGPERVRAMQSHLILSIANETVSHLRRGFNATTCEEVAKIILKTSDVDAVAITNKKIVLAYAGITCPNYEPAKNFKNYRNELDKNRIAFFGKDSEEKMYSNVGDDFSWNGIAVPLKIQEKTIGTLDFFYKASKKITENRITVAKGLGELLGTQLELSELERQQAHAFRSELKALRAQINPHFLFNTLNTIAALCRTDPKNARRLIISFAEFFRESLERQSQFTTLDEELRYVNAYLEFEKARFGPKLRIEKRIDKRAGKVKLPAMIVQPLVENAIKHGMSADGKLTLVLSATLDDERLVVKVQDNGTGMLVKRTTLRSDSNNKGLGIGLTNIKERLTSLYGSAGLINIHSTSGKGTEVTLRIPIHRRPSES
ncbi:MAG TPA: sensor histidine kinase [Actinobacteria bacterium]|nr:sensor histidine kinase [Actinomycetota bacterium]